MSPITTINPEPVEDDLEQMATKAIEICSDVFEEAPLPYAFIPLMGDVLMVAGGIKAGTELTFVGETHNQQAVYELQTSLDKYGLAIEFWAFAEKGKYPTYSYFLYNKETLKKATFGSSIVPPYTGGNVKDWINTSIASGHNAGAVYGKYFSYPESAVADFITVEKQRQRKIISTLFPHTIAKTSAIHSYNETYLHTGEPKADVVKREKIKDRFFGYIQSDGRISEYEQTKRYAESRSTWNRLHPIARRWV